MGALVAATVTSSTATVCFGRHTKSVVAPDLTPRNCNPTGSRSGTGISEPLGVTYSERATHVIRSFPKSSVSFVESARYRTVCSFVCESNPSTTASYHAPSSSQRRRRYLPMDSGPDKRFSPFNSVSTDFVSDFNAARFACVAASDAPPSIAASDVLPSMPSGVSADRKRAGSSIHRTRRSCTFRSRPVAIASASAKDSSASSATRRRSASSAIFSAIRPLRLRSIWSYASFLSLRLSRSSCLVWATRNAFKDFSSCFSW
mmetsp:Transcript_3701/g.13681  ORF Transcript_3701/g.13681 Transcript_3701/m.13681 type:complete len:260 (+) Transcript_3701:372-1151(+)